MCGRYSLVMDLSVLAQRFEFDDAGLSAEPAYNIAPTQQVLTIREGEGGREAAFMRWGLIPPWAKDMSIGARMINARAETVAEKPAFRSALRRRRCLVLADGFYEWQKLPGSKAKRPMRITLRTGEPFAFAGLWEEWHNPDGAPIQSCTIITTMPNELLAPIHDRMPVILSRDAEPLWMDASVGDPDLLSALLRPYPVEAMDAYEVSPLVNVATNDTPEVLARVGLG